MNDLLIFGLLFAAVAIGWYLGRRGASPVADNGDLPSQYYRGLNYLLDGRPDSGVDAFISSLEVNSETLETHIALGRLLRKKGEVERAIRIHQNLLARPSLPREQVHQAHLELALDYISAGLLDRAERLLLDLKDESGEQRTRAMRHLLEIYQSERDWERAIAVAKEMLPRKGRAAVPEPGPVQPVLVALSHFGCELAAQKLQSGEVQVARKLLQDVLRRDRDCVRASLMLGQVEYISGRYREAIRALHRVRQQDPDYIPEAIPTLRQCHVELGEEGALRQWLRDCLEQDPTPALVMAVADDTAQSEGREAACEFLARQLQQRPSLRGLEQLIGLRADSVDTAAREELQQLRELVGLLLQERPAYRCSHCGFAGRQLHWSCPGCKYWGTMKSIRGAQQE